MAYEEGDTVVHPRHGVATVRGISTRVSGDDRTSFLELVFAPASLKVLVPVASIDEVGIRDLPTREEAAGILAILAQPSDADETRAERTASTVERMRSTELAQASMVVRDLTRHAQRSGKRLSATDNAALETCLHSVSSELSLALGITVEEARALILDAVGSGECAS